MADVLLTVSGVIPADLESQVAAGRRPRADYLELACALNADLLDYRQSRADGGAGRWIERVAGPDAALAWACFQRRQRYRLIFTDGEQVGIPLAALLRSKGKGALRHVMISHLLSVGKKMVFFDGLRIQQAVDRFLVYSTWQQEFVRNRWRLPAERVIWTPFQVDGKFFHPAAVACQPERMICAAGLEYRDYATLLDAVADIAVPTVIAAASPWSKRGDSTARRRLIPPHVMVKRFNLYDLRELYARARFVVVPLYDVPFQAGITTLLEAMAMGKAVIVSRTRGQRDVVIDGETGLYVPPGDSGALRNAIRYLLERPQEAQRLGANGRRVVEEQMDVDHYVARLKQIVEQCLNESGNSGDPPASLQD